MCDLSQDKPLEYPWIIRSSNIARRSNVGDDALSMASSYLHASVLSSKSKRMHIDNFIGEQEEIIDRVKKIDDILQKDGANDEKSTKAEMIQKAINYQPPVIEESREEKPKVVQKTKLQPTNPKEEMKQQKYTIKSNENEIGVLQNLLNNPKMLNEIIRLSQMMIDAKIDVRILEFVKRGVNKDHDDKACFITIPEFHNYWKNLIKPEVAHLDPVIEDKVLHFVTTQEGDQVDKHKLFTLIDFYQYYPVYVQKDRNFSKEMYYVMSSNTDGGPTQEKDHSSINNGNWICNFIN